MSTRTALTLVGVVHVRCPLPSCLLSCTVCRHMHTLTSAPPPTPRHGRSLYQEHCPGGRTAAQGETFRRALKTINVRSGLASLACEYARACMWMLWAPPSRGSLPIRRTTGVHQESYTYRLPHTLGRRTCLRLTPQPASPQIWYANSATMVWRLTRLPPAPQTGHDIRPYEQRGWVRVLERRRAHARSPLAARHTPWMPAAHDGRLARLYDPRPLASALPRAPRALPQLYASWR